MKPSMPVGLKLILSLGRLMLALILAAAVGLSAWNVIRLVGPVFVPDEPPRYIPPRFMHPLYVIPLEGGSESCP